jgi:excisionase family DNA binding protein
MPTPVDAMMAMTDALVATAAAQAAAAVASSVPEKPTGGLGFWPPPPVVMAYFKVLTTPEAAQYLRVSESVLLREAEAGRIPGRKLGGEWRFSELAVANWLNTQPPETPAIRKRPPAGVGKDYHDEDPEKVIEAIYKERKKNLVGGA